MCEVLGNLPCSDTFSLDSLRCVYRYASLSLVSQARRGRICNLALAIYARSDFFHFSLFSVYFGQISYSPSGMDLFVRPALL